MVVLIVVFYLFFIDQVVSLDLSKYYHRRFVRKISFRTAFMNIWTNKKDMF